jgi:hypothetical protein
LCLKSQFWIFAESSCHDTRQQVAELFWRQAALTRVDVRPAPWVTGRKIEKVVPERPCFTTLLNRMVPPYFFTMPSDTDNPIPVPLLPFVVKNGSKMCARFSTGIPHPLSETVMRSPLWVRFLQSMDSAT